LPFAIGILQTLETGGTVSARVYKLNPEYEVTKTLLTISLGYAIGNPNDFEMRVDDLRN